MKILHIGYIDPFKGELRGGVESFLTEISHNLKEMGHKVSIIYSSNQNNTKRINGIDIITIRVPNIPINSIGGTIVRKIIYGIKVGLFIGKAWKEFDIIHFHGDNGIIFRNKGNNVMSTFHGFRIRGVKSSRFATGLVSTILLGLIEVNHVRRSNSLITVSQGIRQLLLPFSKRAIDVIYNGVDTRYYSPADKKEREFIREKLGLYDCENLVIFLGSPPLPKGLDIAVNAVKNYSKKLLKMVVIGVDQENAISSGVPETQNVTYLGKLYGDNKLDYLRAADFMIFPSRREGFPITALEGIASGLVVISSKESNFGEIIENWKQGIVVEENTSDNYISVLNSLINKPLQIENIKTEARKLSLEYDWKVISKTYEKAYSELLKRRMKSE